MDNLQDNKPFRKVVWGIAITADESAETKTLDLLNLLVPGDGTGVEPVCVADLSAFDPQFPRPTSVIEERLAKYQSPILKPLKVLAPPGGSGFSISSQVDALVQYATESGADLIVVNTAARTGLPRFLMGSFAETLVLRSSLPTMTLNPNFKVPTKLRTIFFPTDFSRDSQRAFHRTLALAKTAQAKIHIFHKLVHPTNLFVGADGVLSSDLHAYDQQYFEDAQTHLNRLAQEAKDEGVDAITQLDTTPKGQIEMIIKCLLDANCDMVALAARSGPVEALLLGSTTRQVIRQAPCPVWVIHP